MKIKFVEIRVNLWLLSNSQIVVLLFIGEILAETVVNGADNSLGKGDHQENKN